MKLWPAAYPETLRHIACVPCLLLPLDSFLVGQVDKFAAVLLDTLAYFQLSEVYVGVLVLDVLGIKGIEHAHTGRVNDNLLVIAALFAGWHSSAYFGLRYGPATHSGEGEDDGDDSLVHI